MAVGTQLFHADRNQGNAIFIGFDFFRNTDPHTILPSLGSLPVHWTDFQEAGLASLPFLSRSHLAPFQRSFGHRNTLKDLCVFFIVTRKTEKVNLKLTIAKRCASLFVN